MYRSTAKEHGTGRRGNPGGQEQAWYVTEEGTKQLRTMHEDLKPMPTDFYKTIAIYDDPTANYRAMQIQLQMFPLLNDERYRPERVTSSIEIGAARESTTAIRKLQEILQFKAQIAYCKSPNDEYTQSIQSEVRMQNLEARGLRYKMEQLAKKVGHIDI
ncbi:hypothetical protein L6452_12700 [Arctium lappa]|uniref:Uncharacterized protein n=1 Tax=Arctium lappa TaxID=4217 RepID=A0ACB9DRS4_ARCLA|nr:hypothetical protein L6452_12700 [Arctium lappa]